MLDKTTKITTPKPWLRFVRPARVLAACALLIAGGDDVVLGSVHEGSGRAETDYGFSAVRFQGIIHDFVMLNALANTAATRGAIALANDWLRQGFSAQP
jgi:hypothetical protein